MQGTEPTAALLTAPAVARMLGTSLKSVRRLARTQKIPTVHIPHVRGYRFRPASVEALINNAMQPSRQAEARP